MRNGLSLDSLFAAAFRGGNSHSVQSVHFFIAHPRRSICKVPTMSYENDLIAFEEMLHQHGYRVESRTARSFFEQADGNVRLAFDRFVASLSPAPRPVPEWVQLVDPSGRAYYQNNHTQEVPSFITHPQSLNHSPCTIQFHRFHRRDGMLLQDGLKPARPAAPRPPSPPNPTPATTDPSAQEWPLLRWAAPLLRLRT
jgi:hypothetical protein